MYFHALKQSAEQDNATPLESHSVGFEIQMRYRGVGCAFPSAPFVFLLWQSEKGQNASDLPAETVSFWPDPAEHMAQA